MDKEQDWMQLAIDEAKKAAWPFGAVIVIDGKVVAQAGSGGDDDRDPTAHAEVNVIRLACRNLDRQSLTGTGSVMYASCEPCALCMGATWYAGIRKIVFGSTIKEMEEYLGYGDLIYPLDVLKEQTNGELEVSSGFMKEEVMEVYKQNQHKN